jgi:MHS family proline/betaine transporter-like MFS transporter
VSDAPAQRDEPHALRAVSLRRVIIAGIAGNAMEWYDFAVYGYFAPVIGARFFPASTKTEQLIAAFGVFAAGFLMRPLGAIVFGHIGDRIGRRAALTLSVTAMAVPTTLMGLLPDYQQIGLTASLLMVALRLLQGLSMGGEYTTSITFLVESAPRQRRGWVGSWAPAGAGIGTLLGSAVAAGVNSVLPASAMAAWGWRIPFVFGLAVGLTGLYVRRRVAETLVAPAPAGQLPLLRAIRTHYGMMLRVFAMGLLLGVSFYMSFVFAVTYWQEVVHVRAGEALDINTANMLVVLVTTLAAGWLSDRIGRRPLMIGAALGTVVLAYPLFWSMSRPDALSIGLGQMGFALLLGAYVGPLPAVMTEAFPQQVRCSAISVAYNLGQAVFGGTTPMVATYLIVRSHDDLSPAFYVMAIAAVSLVGLIWKPETTDEHR